jgi:spermidine synthase
MGCADLRPGRPLARVQVKEVLHSAKSDFQDVLVRTCFGEARSHLLTQPLCQVFESETYGRVLVLDGCIQLTERDEFSYQARLLSAHCPTCKLTHPDGRR